MQAAAKQSDHILDRSLVLEPTTESVTFKYSSLAQLAEHAAVNRVVVGSSPTGGAKWPVGQAVKTPPFRGGNMGSNPVRVTKSRAFSSVG